MKYILSHKTFPVLSMEIDEDTGAIISLGNLYAPERVPVGVPVSGNSVDRRALNSWWTGRSIPASRSGLREALQTMQIPSPQLLLTKCFGLSLSDQYWVYPEGSGLKWEEINFFDNPFSDDVGSVLFGEVPGKDFDLVSPDNTSDGWLQKKWVVTDGKRNLIKGGSGATRQEPYNEVLASCICRRLGIPHIPYSLTMINGYPYSVCEDFVTKDTELISAWHINQTQNKPNHVSNYQHFVNCCESLKIPDVTIALDHMLAVDFLIVNEDRHMNNFGAVRDANTLEWIGMAPIYDCGTSMWCNEPTSMIRPLAKQPSRPFRSDHSEQIKLVSSFKTVELSALKGIDEEFREILSGSEYIDAARRDALRSGLCKRVEQLGEYIKLREQPQAQRRKREPER